MVTVVQLDGVVYGQYIGYSIAVCPMNNVADARSVTVSTNEHIVLRMAMVNELLLNTRANRTCAVRPRLHVHINVTLGLDVLLYGGIAW